MPCGWGGGNVKSMVQIELKTLKEKTVLLCSASHIRAISAPSPTHFPGVTSSQVFPPAKRPPQPNSTGSPRLATASVYPPLSSLPLWAGGLVTFFFPRTLLSSSCSPHRGHLSQEARGNTQFLLLAPACVLLEVHSPLQEWGCDQAQNPAGSGGGHIICSPWSPP